MPPLTRDSDDWSDIGLDFYDEPDTMRGYRGSATQNGFRALVIPRVGERLIHPTDLAIQLPGPLVHSVEHHIDSVRETEDHAPTVIIVSRATREGEPIIRRLQAKG